MDRIDLWQLLVGEAANQSEVDAEEIILKKILPCAGCPFGAELSDDLTAVQCGPFIIKGWMPFLDSLACCHGGALPKSDARKQLRGNITNRGGRAAWKTYLRQEQAIHQSLLLDTWKRLVAYGDGRQESEIISSHEFRQCVASITNIPAFL